MLRPQARLNLYFNSRPHEEVDRITRSNAIYFCISTHDLTKRSTEGISALNEMLTFQLTTSRRGRLVSFLSMLTPPSYFNSRPHEEVDASSGSSAPTSVLFQLTTSRRGRLRRLADAMGMKSISTHDLTKRSTAVFGHDANWGRNFNSRPHEEVDWAGSNYNSDLSLFQLTTSRRGRRCVNGSTRCF